MILATEQKELTTVEIAFTYCRLRVLSEAPPKLEEGKHDQKQDVSKGLAESARVWRTGAALGGSLKL